jgi:hypothetical protein
VQIQKIISALIFLLLILSLRSIRAAEDRSSVSGTVREYTPSKLLYTGQYELKQWFNLYTQTAYFNENGDRTDLNGRSTYLTGISYFLYGLTRNLNVGADLYIKSVREDDVSSSPFSIFKFSSDANSRTTITSIAPKIKFSPLKRFPGLTVQTLVLFPIAADMEGRPVIDKPFLEYDDIQWWTQLFYDHRFSSDFLAYIEADFFLRFASESTVFMTPFKILFHYFMNRSWTLYLQTEVAPSWSRSGVSSYYTQIGPGIKYQLTPSLELETLYSVFPIGKEAGAGQTLNFGIRFIR